MFGLAVESFFAKLALFHGVLDPSIVFVTPMVSVSVNCLGFRVTVLGRYLLPCPFLISILLTLAFVSLSFAFLILIFRLLVSLEILRQLEILVLEFFELGRQGNKLLLFGGKLIPASFFDECPVLVVCITELY